MFYEYVTCVIISGVLLFSAMILDKADKKSIQGNGKKRSAKKQVKHEKRNKTFKKIKSIMLLNSGKILLIAFSLFITGCLIFGQVKKGFLYGANICFAVSILLYLLCSSMMGNSIDEAICLFLNVSNAVFSSAIWILIIAYVKHTNILSSEAFIVLLFMAVSFNISIFNAMAKLVLYISNVYKENKKTVEVSNTVLGVLVSAATLIQMSYSLYKLIMSL